jgi:hypothetical protein
MITAKLSCFLVIVCFVIYLLDLWLPHFPSNFHLAILPGMSEPVIKFCITYRKHNTILCIREQFRTYFEIMANTWHARYEDLFYLVFFALGSMGYRKLLGSEFLLLVVNRPSLPRFHITSRGRRNRTLHRRAERQSKGQRIHTSSLDPGGRGGGWHASCCLGVVLCTWPFSFTHGHSYLLPSRIEAILACWHDTNIYVLQFVAVKEISLTLS